MQAVFNAYFHLDRVVAVRRHAEGVDPNVLLLDYILHPARYRNTNKIPNLMSTLDKKRDPKSVPKLDVNPMIAFELLLDIFEVEVERLSLAHLPRCR